VSLSGWIKIDVNLHEKPEVIQLSSILGIPVEQVMGCLFRIWSWFDQHTDNGHALRVTYVTLDRFVCHTGFAEALNLVGWIAQDGADLSLPNFDRHNGKSAKKRALDAERQAKKRHELVVTHVTSNLVPEKRREDLKRKSFRTSQIDGVIHSPPEKPEDLEKSLGKAKSEELKRRLLEVR
jgi:hypothetical protein